ncbi:MAG: hypothetical protein KA886_11105 [Candidatus Cloacimonetes bacterium]|nr:hypothetical protein [Candidatus Cloacimonadota bacterium]HPM01097.1 hypothetical protein [Candidatus Cloacimonadota bacterium]
MKVFFSKIMKDYPKKAGDMHLAWYNQGQICVSRKKSQPKIQKQNIQIHIINHICKSIWEKLLPACKREMATYANLYKKTYPGLRKRGISCYSVLLMITHSLIKHFAFHTESLEGCTEFFLQWISAHSIYQMIQMKMIKRVRYAYRLNYKIRHQNISLDTLTGDMSSICLDYSSKKRITHYISSAYLHEYHINSS